MSKESPRRYGQVWISPVVEVGGVRHSLSVKGYLELLPGIPGRGPLPQGTPSNLLETCCLGGSQHKSQSGLSRAPAQPESPCWHCAGLTLSRSFKSGRPTKLCAELDVYFHHLRGNTSSSYNGIRSPSVLGNHLNIHSHLLIINTH